MQTMKSLPTNNIIYEANTKLKKKKKNLNFGLLYMQPQAAGARSSAAGAGETCQAEVTTQGPVLEYRKKRTTCFTSIILTKPNIGNQATHCI